MDSFHEDLFGDDVHEGSVVSGASDLANDSLVEDLWGLMDALAHLFEDILGNVLLFLAIVGVPEPVSAMVEAVLELQKCGSFIHSSYVCISYYTIASQGSIIGSLGWLFDEGVQDVCPSVLSDVVDGNVPLVGLQKFLDRFVDRIESVEERGSLHLECSLMIVGGGV
jgi:hypothetical protein